MDGLHIQVDSPPEFRLQCLDNNIDAVDLCILTHGHADHVVGMDDLRRFCDMRHGEALPVYSNKEGLERISEIFPYAVCDKAIYRGYPAFSLRLMPPVLELPVGRIRSTVLPHGKMKVLGLVFEEESSGKKFVYYTDCKVVSPEQRELAKGADLVVLDALRQEPHPTHMCIAEAIETAEEIDAPITYFTHLTHTVEHTTTEATLPQNIRLAHDGLRIKL
ncbi:MAG: MBL fold metallo-hydrolase [Opitutales bacterium]